MWDIVGTPVPLFEAHSNVDFPLIERLLQLQQELPGNFVGWIPTDFDTHLYHLTAATYGPTSTLEELPDHDDLADSIRLPVSDGDFWISSELL
jgi:hypothetical protein